MIFGHLAVAALAKRRLLGESFLFLMLASFGPDLLDKTAQALLGFPSRGLGHSLLVWVAITGSAWCFCRRFNYTLRLLYLGSALWLIHLATDLVEPKVLLWPWLGPLPESPSYSLIEKLYLFYILRSHQIQFYLDVSFIVFATAFWVLYAIRKRMKVIRESGVAMLP
jgi:hypothetical protein